MGTPGVTSTGTLFFFFLFFPIEFGGFFPLKTEWNLFVLYGVQRIIFSFSLLLHNWTNPIIQNHPSQSWFSLPPFIWLFGQTFVFFPLFLCYNNSLRPLPNQWMYYAGRSVFAITHIQAHILWERPGSPRLAFNAGGIKGQRMLRGRLMSPRICVTDGEWTQVLGSIEATHSYVSIHSH